MTYDVSYGTEETTMATPTEKEGRRREAAPTPSPESARAIASTLNVAGVLRT
jgi:hypothetical protein